MQGRVDPPYIQVIQEWNVEDARDETIQHSNRVHLAYVRNRNRDYFTHIFRRLKAAIKELKAMPTATEWFSTVKSQIATLNSRLRNAHW